jgi:hypothetical protein
MTDGIAGRWYVKFLEVLRLHENSSAFRDAALAARLMPWTSTLTKVVVATCEASGWKSAAKGHRSTLLPAARQEYLGLDVVAFEQSGDCRWRFPVAAFELENSKSDDRVAYSVWKVLCIRAHLRVVFCYRQDSSDGSKLVRHLSAELSKAMAIPERSILRGETMLIVGSRSEMGTFPYGFFKEWVFDPNLGRFKRP